MILNLDFSTQCKTQQPPHLASATCKSLYGVEKLGDDLHGFKPDFLHLDSMVEGRTRSDRWPSKMTLAVVKVTMLFASFGVWVLRYPTFTPPSVKYSDYDILIPSNIT